MGALTVAMDGLLLSYRCPALAAQTVFNFGNLTLSVWLSGTLFFAASGMPHLFTAPSASSQLLVPLALMAATYFLINSGFTAAVIAIESRQRPVDRVAGTLHRRWRRPMPPAPRSRCCSSSHSGRSHFIAIALIRRCFSSPI